MILRIGHWITAEPAAGHGSGQGAWQAFANSQQHVRDFVGCISQPAHAALAAQLASALDPRIFGTLPPDVIESIGRHDAGWAESDLAALERAGEREPQSFVACLPQGAIAAWRRSIRHAEERSALAGILTSRHFCMLAPRDSDPHHAEFVEQEEQRRAPQEAASSVSGDDLNRFTAALGFCDVLSLCLCAGLTGSVRIPLAHPADPASQHTPKATVSLTSETLRFDPPMMAPGTLIHVDGWLASSPHVLTGHRFHWTAG